MIHVIANFSTQTLAMLLTTASSVLLRSGTARRLLRASPSPYLLYQPSSLSLLRFSSDSHDDFAPKRKVISDDENEALKIVKEQVENNRIMLYMKGNPSMPMCGFSARVVQILQKEDVSFSSVNVLDYPSIREGVKKFSDWPTIPQLYVDGEFVGGCDIVTSMHENGELKDLLKEKAS